MALLIIKGGDMIGQQFTLAVTGKVFKHYESALSYIISNTNKNILTLPYITNLPRGRLVVKPLP
jgi:hypothetical protein